MREDTDDVITHTQTWQAVVGRGKVRCSRRGSRCLSTVSRSDWCIWISSWRCWSPQTAQRISEAPDCPEDCTMWSNAPPHSPTQTHNTRTLNNTSVWMIPQIDPVKDIHENIWDYISPAEPEAVFCASWSTYAAVFLCLSSSTDLRERIESSCTISFHGIIREKRERT